MTTPEPPPRSRITSPRSVEQEIDESTGMGEVYMRSLIRSQLRLALTVLFTLLLTVGMLPLAFALFGSFFDFSVWGIPAPWLILGFGVYPYLFAGGWVYVRQCERTERDFADLVERP